MNIINLYYYGDYTEKPKTVAKYLRHLEAADYPDVYLLLASTYQNDQGLLKKSAAKAIYYYIRAEILNNEPGYECLGKMYYEGKDVPQNYETAISYFMIAGDCYGFPESCFIVGDMYENGHVIERDEEKAKQYYQTGIERWERSGLSKKVQEEYGIDDSLYRKAKQHLAILTTK